MHSFLKEIFEKLDDNSNPLINNIFSAEVYSPALNLYKYKPVIRSATISCITHSLLTL